jgi:hypothetical protein
MKIKAINLTRTIQHTLTFDDALGTDDAVIFELGALDSRVLAAIKDRATGIPVSALSGGGGDATATLNINQTNFDVVLFGLKGFKNLKYDDDTTVEFKTANTNLGGKTYLTADPDVVKMLPPEAIDELSGVIMDFNSIKAEERKN